MDKIDKQFSRRFKVTESALREVLSGSFGARKLPADLILADFFRKNRNCGSHDRNFISQHIYHLLRHWGWMRQLIPAERLALLETGKISLQSRDVAAMLAFGCGCAQEDPSDALALLSLTGIGSFERIGRVSDPEERACFWSGIFGERKKFSYLQLIPDDFPEVSVGFDLSGYCRRLASRPGLWVRLRTPEMAAQTAAELSDRRIPVQVHPQVPGAMRIAVGSVNFRELDCFKCGVIEIQDLASQCVGLTAAPKPGERWFDACAGAGGKTLQLASLMSGRGRVDAGDIREKALEELRLRAKRGNWSNISCHVHDGKHWYSNHKYDGVLVDAPCSGSGVWRRNPLGQWKFSRQEIADFAARQQEILQSFSSLVRPGGALVYATCSIFKAENEQVVENFLEQNRDFEPVLIKHPLTGAETFYMHAGNGEADCDELFACRMVRKQQIGE